MVSIEEFNEKTCNVPPRLSGGGLKGRGPCRPDTELIRSLGRFLLPFYVSGLMCI